MNYSKILRNYPLIAFAFVFASPGEAQIAASADYVLVYGQAASSGRPAESASYKTAGLVITAGAALKATTSASYGIAPVNGKTLTNTSTVADWQLY